MKSLSFHAVGLVADSINDASSTRKVYLLAAGLAVLGVALVVVTVWFWRSTRHDPELLGPLEVMGGRRFRRLDGGEQRQVLDQSRPADAKPMQWGVQRGEASSDPEGELGGTLIGSIAAYDELRDPALIASAHEDIASGIADADVPAGHDADPRGLAAVNAADDDMDSILAEYGITVPGITRRTAAMDAADAKDVSDDAVAATATAEEAPITEPKDDLKDDLKDETEVDSKDDSDDEPSLAVLSDMSPADADLDADGAAAPAEAVVPAPRSAATDKGDGKPRAHPLVIVPVDHDLRPSVGKTVDPVSIPDAVPADAAVPTIEPQQPASIDPLLRMFERHEG